MHNCPTCGSKTEVVRSMAADGMKTDYICRECSIAWYINENGEFKIRLSTTHSLASRLDEKEFKKLIEIIKQRSD